METVTVSFLVGDFGETLIGVLTVILWIGARLFFGVSIGLGLGFEFGSGLGLGAAVSVVSDAFADNKGAGIFVWGSVFSKEYDSEVLDCVGNLGP